MKTSKTEILFYRGDGENEKGMIRHDLTFVRVHSLDSPDKKIMNNHYRLQLTSQKGHRKLYFTEFSEMQKAAIYLLKS